MRITLIALLLTLAACSSDSGDAPRFLADTGSSQPDATAEDLSTNDAGNDDMSSSPDVGQADMAQADMSVADMAAGDMAVADMSTGDPLYVGTANPYATGPLAVTVTELVKGSGPNVDITVYSPAPAGTYPVIIFQHGFSLRSDYYSTMLTHVASHGFVVVAPQMYEPSFFGSPTTAEEAAAARVLYAWVQSSLPAQLNVGVDPTFLGLAGHSRGAKVLWLAVEAGFSGALAVAGLDPVDGKGGPFGNEPRVLDGGLDANLPSLILGTELGSGLVFGQACAPAGDNYEAFYAAAPSPSYEVFAEGYGHLDMLDADKPGCGVTCNGCVNGPTDGKLRTFSAGQLVAFFRWQLQGDNTAETFLTDTTGAPLTAQTTNK